ncbi:hypothetical protein EYF80_031812 [Liparis tanakae]|uniref:Uncharacterized protein n=1 Tax=Liparis tanakae TaxID=230148 RepID=A0A4Z2GWN3_9TELE|nr:hypothetical protein EYF80_031812 [Liparis tanakae]
MTAHWVAPQQSLMMATPDLRHQLQPEVLGHLLVFLLLPERIERNSQLTPNGLNQNPVPRDEEALQLRGGATAHIPNLYVKQENVENSLVNFNPSETTQIVQHQPQTGEPPTERRRIHGVHPLHFGGGEDATVPASVFSLAPAEASVWSLASAPSSSLRGKNRARAAPAVPSPLWREKQRKVAQTKAQQPVKAVRRYRGTRAKFTS